jgi:hypothetical protein
MTDAADPIPNGTISTREAFDIVYQTITPDRQTLEERLNPSSKYYDAFKGAKKKTNKSAKKTGRKGLKKGLKKDPEKNPKEAARREASRNVDQAELHASKVLRKKLSQGAHLNTGTGALVVLFGKKRKTAEKISPDVWASMSDFEAMLIFLEGKLIVRGKRRILYFDPENFENFIKVIAPPDGDKAAHLGERAPTTRKARAERRDKLIRDFYNQRWPGGFIGRTKVHNKEIRDAFPESDFGPLKDWTIRRALAPLKSR